MTPKKSFKWNRVLLPVVSLGLLFVFWRLGLKVLTVPVIIFMLFYYFVLPDMVRRQKEKFHRQALLLLTSGRAKDVPALVKKSWLLQLTDQRAAIEAKLALAYLQSEQYERAAESCRRALPEVPASEGLALRIGLAKALFVTGDMAGAEREGTRVLENTDAVPELMAMVAHARLALGKTDEKTKALLAEAKKLAAREDVNLMIDLVRIELALKNNTEMPNLPENADSKQSFIRAWLHLIRGTLQERKGDLEKAKRSFTFATKEPHGGTFAEQAQKKLEEPAAEERTDGPKPQITKSAKRRKRRR